MTVSSANAGEGLPRTAKLCFAISSQAQGTRHAMPGKPSGALSFGYFSLGKQRKVPRLSGRAPALYTINTYEELLNTTKHHGKPNRGHEAAPTTHTNKTSTPTPTYPTPGTQPPSRSNKTQPDKKNQPANLSQYQIQVLPVPCTSVSGSHAE